VEIAVHEATRQRCSFDDVTHVSRDGAELGLVEAALAQVGRSGIECVFAQRGRVDASRGSGQARSGLVYGGEQRAQICGLAGRW
jgi:hypothetical protein